jgi:hypothetical protein
MLSELERRQRRQEWIDGFAQRQHAAREYIRVSELADWCARSATAASAAAEEQARTLAYQRLDQSARGGEFERDLVRGGRVIRVSEIRYLDADLLRFRLTREQLGHVLGGVRDLAPYCYVPRHLAQRWLAAHGHPWPAHFNPVPDKRSRAYDPNEPLTLADQLRLLVEEGVAKDEAKGRLAASAPELRIKEAAGLTVGEVPSADFPSQRVEESEKPATSTASYSEVRSAIEKHGPGTEKELLTAVGKATPGKRIPRRWVRDARDELFGKRGRTGRPKSPK